jgi:hypothetical protein
LTPISSNALFFPADNPGKESETVRPTLAILPTSSQNSEPGAMTDFPPPIEVTLCLLILGQVRPYFSSLLWALTRQDQSKNVGGSTVPALLNLPDEILLIIISAIEEDER